MCSLHRNPPCEFQMNLHDFCLGILTEGSFKMALRVILVVALLSSKSGSLGACKCNFCDVLPYDFGLLSIIVLEDKGLSKKISTGLPLLENNYNCKTILF